ncbi:MAG: YchJ family protein [Planctomycetes bacterium]|nr:YchJ family protein [Planctomycetota bacterium]
MNCHCGMDRPFEACCGPYIQGLKPAPTAETLMRSRYSAYVEGAIDYVIETNDPSERDKVDRESTERWSKDSEWHGLDVVEVEDGGEDDSQGTVEFIARFTHEGEPQAHHEVAKFRRLDDGRWYYLDGKMKKGQTFKREEIKVGRNDPCPCGSGKKHKKCCGAAA